MGFPEDFGWLAIFLIPPLLGGNKSRGILLYFFVIWLLYGIKPLYSDPALNEVPDEAMRRQIVRIFDPLPDRDLDDRQVERRAQPSLPVAGNRDRWPTEDRHTFTDLMKLSLEQRGRADAREAITHEIRDEVAAVRARRIAYDQQLAQEVRNADNARHRGENYDEFLINTKLLQTQLAADPKNALKQRALYDQIRRNWVEYGWTRQHPFIRDLIREDLPEEENILEVPRHVLLNRIGYNPLTDRSPQEFMVAIGVVDQANFDVWLAEPSGAGVPFRQEDLYDLVRMRGLDIAAHVAGWDTPLDRGRYNRMFPEGVRNLEKFERSPVDRELLRPAQMGQVIGNFPSYGHDDSTEELNARLRWVNSLPANMADYVEPSLPAPLPPSVQTIKYVDDPDGTIEAE